MEMLRMSGYEPGNVDATVVAELPKLRPYIPAMQQTLAEVMQLDPDDLSIKATTSEKLGFTGRGEGIAAYASVLLYS
jgi:2-C-methyl-D-erythritol 2,4-cyclodiphosphate synthase